MTSDQIFMYLAPRCLLLTLLIIVAIAGLCFLGHLKAENLKNYWHDVRMAIIGIGTFVFFILMMIVFFLPNSAISDFLPTIKHSETIVLPAEVIEEVNIIEQENVIDIPSIVLPLQPEGEQAIVIDTSSEDLKKFMNDFYGENVEFFNQRQKATYLLNSEGIENFTGLDFDSIQYKENTAFTINLDQLGYETIWLFTDLSNIELEPTTCKVILYVPRNVTQSELEALKELGDITVITIEKK